MTMNIVTSNCSFSKTPTYFISVGGFSNQWALVGHTSAINATSTSFTIYATPGRGYNGAQLSSYSQSFMWDVNWMGISYS